VKYTPQRNRLLEALFAVLGIDGEKESSFELIQGPGANIDNVDEEARRVFNGRFCRTAEATLYKKIS
jgi:hypothetical protein